MQNAICKTKNKLQSKKQKHTQKTILQKCGKSKKLKKSKPKNKAKYRKVTKK